MIPLYFEQKYTHFVLFSLKKHHFFTRLQYSEEETFQNGMIFAGKNLPSTDLLICAFSRGGEGGDPKISRGIYPPEKAHLTVDLAI